MDSKKITAATIVSAPSATTWSQAYSAGNLFAALSLTQNDQTTPSQDTLSMLGKEILNTLEAEYFTLETKNLESIQNAITIALKHVQEKHITLSACIASVSEDILYVFALGGAKAYMKRADKLGLLLLGKDPILASASGFLEPDDVLLLETHAFGMLTTKEKLTEATNKNHPIEITETLSSFIHDYEKGNEAAVVFAYHKPQAVPEEATPEKTEEIENVVLTTEKEEEVIVEASAEETQSPKKSKFAFLSGFTRLLKFPHFSLTGKRKFFLLIAILIIFLIGFGVFYTTKQKETAKQQALFQQVYADAQKKYEEGQSLAGLNKNLSRDDFTQAQDLIEKNKASFANNPVLKAKIDTLLKNIQDQLSVVSGVNRVNAKPVDSKTDPLLNIALENNPLAIAQDDTAFYTIDDTAVFSFDKKNQSKKTKVKNSDTWQTVGGLGAYINNLYVLDKDKGQILKLTGSNSSDYLSSKQDLSKAQSIAIDGSIWILFSDGTIQKWTRGKQDSFTVSGLDTPLSNPTRIFTNTDTDNLYILDNGNSRVVVISKNGTYQTQYQTDAIKTATEFDVLEKDKKIYVLSGKKVWEIDFSSN